VFIPKYLSNQGYPGAQLFLGDKVAGLPAASLFSPVAEFNSYEPGPLLTSKSRRKIP
jgi:hypothetical protein